MKRCTLTLDCETELESLGKSFKLYECSFGVCRGMSLRSETVVKREVEHGKSC